MQLLFKQERYLEQLVAQFIDGSGVDEGFVFHDVEYAITHFDLNAHLEPLVVNIEAGTKFTSKVETFRDKVVDEFVAIAIGFLVVLL